MVKFSDLEKGNLDSTKSPEKSGGEWVRPSGLSFRDLEKKTQRITPSTAAPQEVREEERKALYDSAAEYLKDLLDAVRRRRRFSLEPGEEIIDRMIEFRSADDPLLMRAVYQDTPSDFLANHCVNVTVFALKMAAELGLSRTEQKQIGLAALLHEIGMGLLSEKLIYKGQSLNQEESAVFKKRPEFSYKILKGFGDEYAFLAETALQVHECLDGSGYPMGLKGDEIHLYAQIIGLVDFYEALIHPRPQRDKFLHFDAVKQVIKTGKQRYPKKLIKTLLNIFSIFPLHSLVKLNSNAIGRVIQTYPEQPMRPKIEVLFDSQGRRVLARHVVDLSENSILFIVEAVSEKDLPSFADKPAVRRFPKTPPSIHYDSDSTFLHAGEDADAEAPQDGGYLEITEDDFEPQPSITAKDSPETSPKNFTSGDKDRWVDERAKQRPGMERGYWVRRYKWALILVGCLVLAWLAIWLLGLANFGSKNTQKTIITPKPPGKKASVSPQRKTIKVSAASTAPKKGVRQPAAAASLKEENSAPALGDKRSSQENTQSIPAPPKDPAPPARQAAFQTPPAAAASPPADGTVVPLPEKRSAADTAPIQTAAVASPTADAAALKARDGFYPFSIKLDSFRTIREVRASLPLYRTRNLKPYWVKVNLGSQGVWYRVFVGYYPTRKQAAAAVRDLRLEGASVKETKYAALIRPASIPQSLDQKIKWLSDKGYCPYVIQDGDQPPQLFVGAFFTRKGAEDQVADLLDSGIQSEIIER